VTPIHGGWGFFISFRVIHLRAGLRTLVIITARAPPSARLIDPNARVTDSRTDEDYEGSARLAVLALALVFAKVDQIIGLPGD
jgi:hypothetical protein